jgi:iron complex transport system permease protein
LAFTVGRYRLVSAICSTSVAQSSPARPPGVPTAVENVIWQVRGPARAGAAFVGAALAVAGTAFQGLFRNPLVSPDLLGAVVGAALGAVLGIYFSLGVFAIQAFAFVGGLVAVARRLSDRLGGADARSDPGAGSDRRG